MYINNQWMLFPVALSPSADVFEKSLIAGFIKATDYVEIWQAFLDYLRRRRVDFSKGERRCVEN